MNNKILGKIFLFLAGLGMSGCSVLTPAPTPDMNVMIAAAVQTVEVRMTESARLNPSATPLPTATPLPSPTPIPPTATVTATAATAGTQAAGAGALSTPAAPGAPAATATQGIVNGIAGKFLYAATFPENKREYMPNEKFGLALGFQNMGTVTWEAGSYVKLVNFTGEITVQTELKMDKNVGSGEKIEFGLWAFGSEMLGSHTWVFQVYTPAGGAIPGAAGAFSYKSY